MIIAVVTTIVDAIVDLINMFKSDKKGGVK